MFILGNPLLGRNFSFYGYKLNENGLFFLSRNVKNEIVHEILITDDEYKIVSMMELDYDEVKASDYENFFSMLITCPYFKRQNFTRDISEGEVQLFNLFAEYIKGRCYSSEFKPLSINYVLNYLREDVLLLKIKKSRAIIEKRKDIKKLDGRLILKHIPDFEKKKLGEAIYHFLVGNVFEDEIERDFFLLISTEEDIIEKFKETLI